LVLLDSIVRFYLLILVQLRRKINPLPEFQPQTRSKTA
jgi:hypothetical protein